MRLKRIDLKKDLKFSSMALVTDEDIHDRKRGTGVALVLYHPQGHLVFMLRDGYDPMEVLLAGEKTPNETLRASRFKLYKCQLITEERG